MIIFSLTLLLNLALFLLISVYSEKNTFCIVSRGTFFFGNDGLSESTGNKKKTYTLCGTYRLNVLNLEFGTQTKNYFV